MVNIPAPWFTSRIYVCFQMVRARFGTLPSVSRNFFEKHTWHMSMMSSVFPGARAAEARPWPIHSWIWDGQMSSQISVGPLPNPNLGAFHRPGPTFFHPAKSWPNRSRHFRHKPGMEQRCRWDPQLDTIGGLPFGVLRCLSTLEHD